MIAAARAQLVHDVIRPSLSEGRIVISDRYTPSTWAYQGGGRGLSREAIQDTIAIATGGLDPDLVVLLDLAPEVGLRRKKGSGHDQALSRFEAESADFSERVRRSYLEQARSSGQNWLVLDAELPPAVVSEQIWHACEQLIGNSHSRRIALPRESGMIHNRSKEGGE
jgi:dTMP kinase